MLRTGFGGENNLSGPLEDVHLGYGRCELYFQLVYNEGINRNAGVFNLWMDSCCNLQRLDFEGLSIDIRLEYMTPWYRNRRILQNEQQYHRLQDVVRETHMAFLSKWFPKAVAGGRLRNEAIEYWPSGSRYSQREHLMLDLRRLSELRPITKDIEEFRNRLKLWKRYNEDRDFSGDYAETIPS